MPPQETCRICSSKDLEKIFSLGEQPLANGLLDKPIETPKYPLELCRCARCTLMQLNFTVPKEERYDNYVYIPSVSKTHLEHFQGMAEGLVKDLNLKPGSLVVDVGSSDGSFLRPFQGQRMSVLGIEPAKHIADLAYQNAVPTLSEYFTPDTAKKIVELTGRAKLVTMTNVMTHIDDLQGLLTSLDVLLDDDGVFFAQFPDSRNLLKENQFDTIYHEHVSYFTYEPLHYLFAHSQFELFRVDESPIHGGSMRIYVRRRPPLLEQFAQNVEEIKERLYTTVAMEKASERRVVGFGAAAKGTVLLNACGLDHMMIDYIADGTPFKQGKYMPGVNIPILPEETLRTNKPDTILILAWNFKDEIMKKLAWGNFRFIVPIPRVEVIDR